MSNVTFADAAYEILKKQGHPLSADEITSAALSQGLISTSGKTPSATMSARLYIDIKQMGDKSRFVKAEKGKFGLREWSASPIAKVSRFRPLSFKDAAYKVLKAENRPMAIEDITDIALKRGLLKTTGKTPGASMGVQLYTDIKIPENQSVFVQLGKNRFGLREWVLDVLKEDIEKAEKEKVTFTADRKRSIVGDPINYKGLIYRAPE